MKSALVIGTEITTFDAEIVDVVSGDASATDGPRVLVRLSGPVVDESGVGPGFSGSPIYCADANGVSDPDELLVPGRRIRITHAQGFGGVAL